MNKVLCVIPARGGSKRIKNKNTKPFAGGKSLVILACEQAMRLSENFEDIVLTSDSNEAIEQGKQCGIPHIRRRPDHLCTDSALSEDAIDDVITWMKETKDVFYNFVLLLEPTSALRSDEDIIESIRLAKETGRGVKSVVLVKNCIDGEVISDRYQLEGSIHLWCTDWIRDTPYDRFNLLVVPPERAWHIDYQWQFDCAEMLFMRQNTNK